MHRRLKWLVVLVMIFTASALAQKIGSSQWQNDLTPISASDWNYDLAAHLLERAGFGGTPEEIQALAQLTPAEAVRQLVHFQNIENKLPPFEHSGIHDWDRTFSGEQAGRHKTCERKR